MLRQLDDHTLVAGQVTAADLPSLAAQGITTIINNRPDEEEPEQPSGTEIAAAAEAAGLRYHHIPVAGGFSEHQVADMAEALSGAEGRTLAFCRSGTRSTFLWALARKRQGADGQELITRAAEAGYDLRPIAGHLSD